MACGVFALIGVALGMCLTLFSKGEIIYDKKRKPIENTVDNEEESAEAKSERQLMRQWQNLLSYGVERENEKINF